MHSGWSPLPFALRLASINRKKKEEEQKLKSSMLNDIHRSFRNPPSSLIPSSPIESLPSIDQRLKQRPELSPPPPPKIKLPAGLAAYTEPQWIPDRRKHRQRRRRSTKNRSAKSSKRQAKQTRQRPESDSLSSTHDITKIRKKNRTSFLWLPYFRKGSGFTEDGRNMVVAQQMYEQYVEQHSFAFNNCGTYYVEGSLPNRKFYGVALDLDQARVRLIDLMRQERAPPRLQEIFNQTSDERNIQFHIVQRISPFYRKVVDTEVGQKINMKVSRSFNDYRSRLFEHLKKLILKHNVTRVHRIKIFPIVWKEWRLHVSTENKLRYNAALRIQGQWRKRAGTFALHLKRVAKKQALEEKARIEIKNIAAHKLQHWWSRMNGSFSAKIKARAKMQMIKEEQEQTDAAKRIQRWWSMKNGSFAAKMKARAEIHLKQEEEEMNRAALKIQAAWRRRQGSLALHLKRQAKAHVEREDKAVRTIQHWFNVVSGSFSAKIKARAKMQMIKEEQEQTDAAKRIQRWWSMKNGSFAAKMKARAEIHLKQEEEEMNRAALKIQVAWRRRQGGLGKHMKRQAQKYADEQEALEIRAVLKLQLLYRQKHGKLAYHMASSQRRQEEEDRQKRERAAVYLQYRWRVSKGMLAQHLIRQARRRVKRRRKKRKTEILLYEYTETRASAWNNLLWNEMQDPVDNKSNDWMKCWDDYYQAEYWFNRQTEESTWEDPILL